MDVRQVSWGEDELYELLCLMLIGACVWIGGRELGLFEAALDFAARHNLLDLLVLVACMGMGVFVSAVRKSILLRRAMEARLEAERRAEIMARHDVLTGLANRRFFLECFDAHLKAAKKNQRFAMLMIDLDRFKPVNDLHGHAAGNAVLCAVADRLGEFLPQGTIVARLGGDEFAALAPFENEDQLAALVESLIAAIRAPVPWKQGHVDVDATIGVAFVEPGKTKAEQALHEADLAMYEGKREGRGRFCFFHEALESSLKARMQLEAELRNAINRNEITPFFQPIVQLPSKQLMGFEVLARWVHPDKGLIAPDAFIRIAEETGLINDLFYNLLRRACTIAGNWPPHLSLAVNVAPQQLQDSRMPSRILSVLTETGFAPGRLEIEITETALVNDLESARSTLASLQNLGVKIALDDFGTGYSSLYNLSELRFDKLKIDKSYVASLIDDDERAKLVDAIIQLGASLSLQTTAEGVETLSDLDWLSRQGCAFGQGYLFGSPMPEKAVEQFLQTTEKDGGPSRRAA